MYSRPAAVHFLPHGCCTNNSQDLQLLQAPTTSAPCYETLGYLAYKLHVTSFRPDSTWYDHEYYPRPRMQGMRHKIRTTRKVAVQNHAEKKPHSIPNEVLLPVNKDLGGLDFRNLQSTCRKKGIKLPSIMHWWRPPLTRGENIRYMMEFYVNWRSTFATRQWVRYFQLGCET
jgi:hypothetical protein